MSAYDWTTEFKKHYDLAAKAYAEGIREAGGITGAEGKAFLAAAGSRAQDLYDYVDDAVRYGEPDYGTALLVTAVLRAHFIQIRKGAAAGALLGMGDYPAKDAAVDGIPWLPRIIKKARTKLAGTMPEDMMYGCGGDRDFFKKHGLHPADFLQAVWKAGSDDAAIIEFVKKRGVV
jgi:hypothetical protein